MVRIAATYVGDLTCEVVHPSGVVLRTDAPADNGGEGREFSPTDLVAAALATCVLTVMGLSAKAQGVDIAGAEVTVEKEMSSSPRRIGALTVQVRMPPGIPEAARAKLERAAMTCPVKPSLHPDVDVSVQFNWS